jgi:hypothetical protein
MKISIKKPSLSQLRKLKQGLEIRVKSGSDIELECVDDTLYTYIEKNFQIGKTCMIVFDIKTKKILSNMKTNTLEESTDDNVNYKEESFEDKETLEKIIEIIHKIDSVDEYMNFSNTLFNNEDKFKDKALLSTIMTLKTLKSNTPYLISYNQYHMISVEILKNLKKII